MQVAQNSQRATFGIGEAAQRWGVSRFTVRRLIDAKEIKTIYIGGRVLIPASEVQRVEQHGAGERARKAR
jgi:excisionase family DNA binding protein